MFYKTLRCSIQLMLLGMLALGFSTIAQAQEHGGYTLKSCGPAVRTCDTAADCTDSNMCTNDFCDTSLPETYNCTFSFNYGDEFGDDLRVSDAWDTIFVAGDQDCPNAGDCEVIGTDELIIYALEGNVVCDNGTVNADLPLLANQVLPCVVGDATTVPAQAAGKIRFRSNTYMPTMDDLPGPLRDQATVEYIEECSTPPDPSCNDTDISLAQAVSQQALVDGCLPSTPITCDDSDACTQESCNPGTGQCETTDRVTCDDSDACTTESCNVGTGLCETTDTVTCDDSDVCTDDFCDPTTGLCDYVDNGTCGEEICRTPGFWGARGGNEKGVNITLAVIGDGLDVCGQQITNTDVNDPESAIEAICINKGDAQAKLMRHLTAASLNCELGACNANTEALLTYCNGICADNDNAGELSFCSDSLDCWNNGGHVMGDLTCVPAGVGICALSGFTCETNDDCDGGPDTCTMYADCHDDTSLCDSNFPEFCPPGPASSPKKCNEARKETGYIFDLPDAGYNP